MLPEDQKRLEREKEIYQATRGPDYSELERLIGLNKAEAAGRQAARQEYMAKRRAGYYMDGAKDGPFIEE